MNSMKKLKLYKTAYSPMFKQFVVIAKVREDIRGVPIIDARFDDGQLIMFRQQELTDYCL